MSRSGGAGAPPAGPLRGDRPLSIYDDCLIPPPHVPAHSRVPLLQLDARDRAQVRALVMAAVGLLEQSRTATA
ncbi:hypothetical protein [Ottowia beijingensis]|uniref:hypothetical protein n=1 Tax=Ottowia beijingensis TaxID=1207057 RepID=UPI002FD9B0CD